MKCKRSSAIADKCSPTPYTCNDVHVQTSVSVIPLAQWRHVYRVDWRLCTAQIPNIAHHLTPSMSGILRSYPIHIWCGKTRMAGLQSCKVARWSTQSHCVRRPNDKMAASDGSFVIPVVVFAPGNPPQPCHAPAYQISAKSGSAQLFYTVSYWLPEYLYVW